MAAIGTEDNSRVQNDFLRTYYVLGTVRNEDAKMSTMSLSLLAVTIIPTGRYFLPHFTDRDTEAW